MFQPITLCRVAVRRWRSLFVSGTDALLGALSLTAALALGAGIVGTALALLGAAQ